MGSVKSDLVLLITSFSFYNYININCRSTFIEKLNMFFFVKNFKKKKVFNFIERFYINNINKSILMKQKYVVLCYVIYCTQLLNITIKPLVVC